LITERIIVICRTSEIFLIVCVLSLQYCHSFFVTRSSSVSLLFIYILPGDATGAITCRTGLSLCLAAWNQRTIFLLFLLLLTTKYL